MGERYRREMLAHGGAKEPMLMVEGNQPSGSPQSFSQVPVRLLAREWISDWCPSSYLGPQMTS